MLRILRDARTLDRLDVAAYVVASTDARSADRALAFERSRRGARGEARVLTIGRAREVGQRWTTSAATTAARVRGGDRDRRARESGRGDL